MRDSACENGFYNLNINGEDHTLEHKLSNLESIAGAIINKICKEETLSNITDEEHMDLCIFLSNLILRVKRQREWLSQLNSSLKEWLEAMGLNPNDVENFNFLEKKEIEQQHILFTSENTLEFANVLYEKRIALLKAPTGGSFMISDNPVVLHNYWRKRYQASSGLFVPGIEIRLPLSNKLCLSLICPLLFSDLSEKIDKLNLWKHDFPNISTKTILNTQKHIESIRNRTVFQIDHENLIFSNSLQINQSLTYLYSGNDDFSLVIKMISDHPNLSSGKVLSQNFI